ncbi:MAG: hypothetical protein GF417_00180 [Candidatus Latescibacteria bacterium]|nr:hypothetical protein [bacterium]MBD3422845.1 hypothetical protein [Candidatus Latescibacterota bacterium]
MDLRKLSAMVILFASAALFFFPSSVSSEGEQPGWIKESVMELEKKLIEEYGEEQKERIRKGLKQVASLWRDEDGGEDLFEEFVMENYAGESRKLDQMFSRFEYIFEQIDGHMHEIGMALRRQADLSIGPLYNFDRTLSGYDPSSHVQEDFFGNKIAFAVLLNFPLTTLEERIENGPDWSRRKWAEVRLAQRYSRRVPAEVSAAVSKAMAVSDNYIAGYNIWMHHLVDDNGNRLFPPGMRLLSHWNLRDEIKADYEEGADGLAKQKMIQKVMERIVDQSIPEVVIDNPHVDWNPYTNKVAEASVSDTDMPTPDGMKVTSGREPDTRYRILLDIFRAIKRIDPYSPSEPTHIDRMFNVAREIPEEEAERMLLDVLESPMVDRVAELIRERLGRKLQPFDIWYNGFRSQEGVSEKKLDEIVRERYPDAESFHRDMPNMLRKLGFSPEKADYLAGSIVVEPARGSGHAAGARMRSAKARLRTRVGDDGMDYKGFNIAVHEMGHNVEQVFTLKDVDYTLMEGVPNTAFTEAFAFVFQGNDLMLLGLEEKQSEKHKAFRILDSFWGTREIAAVSLVDMKIWHWMYEHPKASPAELREATLEIAGDVWNEHFAPVFGQKDSYILAIYSHIIHSALYTPDYPIGEMIAVQVRDRMDKAGKIGPEFERMAVIGRVTPDMWMKNATGRSVGAEALLEETEKALRVID